MRKQSFWLLSLLLALFGTVFLMASTQSVFITRSNSLQMVQSEPSIAVLPETLGRISWGAVLAGVVIAMVVQLALNLLGLAIGTTQMDPYDKDAPSVKTLTTSAAVWIGLSTIISLVLGGWIAARFAGIPNNVDGMLHGLMVWGLVSLVTILLISSSVGRLLSGMNILFQRSLDLVGQVTGTIAQGAATVVQAGAGAAQTVVEKAAQATQDAVSAGADTVKQELNEHPEVKQALNPQVSSRNAIEVEIRKLLDDAGIEPTQVDSTVDAAKTEVVDAAKTAAQQAQKGDLREAGETLMAALQTVLDQGRDATKQVDRDNVINLLTSRTKMSREEATQSLSQWEQKYHEARQQGSEVQQQVSGQVEQARAQVENVQAKVSDKVEEVKAQATETAREAADQARKSLGMVALALFAALVVGAIAAGIGGILGAPHELPTASVDTTAWIVPRG